VTISQASSSSVSSPAKGDLVVFSDILGAMGADARPVIFEILTHPKRKTCGDAHLLQFDIDIKSLDADRYPAGSGHMKLFVAPVTSSFVSLARSIKDPGLLSARAFQEFSFDGRRLCRSEQLHVAFSALGLYSGHRQGAVSGAHVVTDAEEFLELCRTVYSTYSSFKASGCMLDESLMRLFMHSLQGSLSPICAIAGAFASQEAIKRCSRKYIPLSDPQWLYYDAFDLIPEQFSSDSDDFQPQHCRYDDQIMLLGRAMHASLGRQNVFVVGAGAIGCELLKNFAMMGVACAGGRLTVTDNDHVEKSNLSRQFLFRSHHIKRSKSLCACEEVLRINPHLK
jgi:ubiquitin-activating enzyme E1